ncbi:MAG TPA: hypothetical protein VNX15_06260, partial [Gemmatimonadales bacterium]|nr:hypothetical protein [Gemmatimonadales bacterium]
MRGVWLVGLLIVAGCSDALERTTPVGQEIVILDGQSASLTLVNAGDFSVTSLPLLFPVSGAPRIAGRGPVILVPGGAHDSLQILILGGSSKVVPVGSPVSAAFQDDTLAWVTDSALGALVQVNVRAAQKVVSPAVSAGPVAAAVTDSQVFSAHDSWLEAINIAGTPTPDSIPLSGTDAHFMVLGDDSLLYVVERGDSGKANGRLSVVDPVARQEIVVINGLGERPGPGVFHPSGRLLISSRTEGILEISTLTRAIVRGPGAGIKPDGKGVLALSL